MDDTSDKVQQGGEVQPTPADSVAQERDEYLAGWKRAKADLINYKKEEDRRFKEVAEFATLGLVRELILGMDSFDLALSATKDDGVRKGIEMIKNQFDEILKRQGVTRIEAKIGAPPDPRFHEAIAEVSVPDDSKHLDGMITEELVAGYKMGERVIRATKVKIGKVS